MKGQLPLNEDVAKTIRKKLERELFEREYRRIVRELRALQVDVCVGEHRRGSKPPTCVARRVVTNPTAW